MDNVRNVDFLSDFSRNSTHFSFGEYAGSIAEAILNPKNETPFTIGIHGKWGAGKTTLMESVRENLESERFLETFEKKRGCRCIRFSPLKYEREEDLLTGLVGEILKPIKLDKAFLEKLQVGVERQGIGVNSKRGVERILKEFLKYNVHDFIKETSYRTKLGFYDTFNEFFKQLIGSYTHMYSHFQSDEVPDDGKGAIVIFMDDLDRCSDIRVLKVFEMLNLFMNHKGFIFVIGASEAGLQKALIKQKYKESHARQFLKKHIQVSFHLPRATPVEFETYLKEHSSIGEKVLPYLDIILPKIAFNIREFKRWINGLHMVYGIHKYRQTQIDFEDILIWNVILLRLPQLKYETLPTQLLLFKRIEALCKKGIWEKKEMCRVTNLSTSVLEISLHNYLENYEIIQLFEKLSLTREQLRELITINETMVSSYAHDGKFPRGKRRFYMDLHDFSIMRPVPKGIFLFGTENKEVFVNSAYEIGVYPVTNEEYGKFMESKGYERKEYWSDKGFQWLKENCISQPKYWKRERLNQPDCPVVGVSFFEASAYTLWARKSLPSEMQWERAARGTQGLRYPWGEDFDGERCNTLQSANKAPTRVTLYPNGISPAGCYDMAGNVWEWTLDPSPDDSGYIVKGGSWIFDRYHAQTTHQFFIQPEKRCDNVGFRCIRS